MQMHALPIRFLSTTYPHTHNTHTHTCFLQPIILPPSSSFPPTLTSIATTSFLFPPHSQTLVHANSPNIDSTILFDDDEGKDDDSDLSGGGMELQPLVHNNNNRGGGGSGSGSEKEGIEIEIEKIGKNSRRIRSRIAIEETELQTVWNILTDYERLADFIPGLALSQLLEKRPNFARIFQIGQQKLAFGLNFNAKGIVDCYEKDLETLPFGQRRDIEFKMIEGDFQLFEGKWSIEQYNLERNKDSDSFVGQDFHTTLTYIVDVEPKMWLPVGLVEGRLCREIKLNLSCIREEAQKAKHDIPDYY